MYFNPNQLDLLAESMMDLAKGLILASLAIPSIATSLTFIGAVRMFMLGIGFGFTSIKIVGLKEVHGH